VKRRTIQVEAFGTSSVTMGRYKTVEVLTGSLLGVPGSPWLFALYDFNSGCAQEKINRRVGVGARTLITADNGSSKSNAREPIESRKSSGVLEFVLRSFVLAYTPSPGT